VQAKKFRPVLTQSTGHAVFVEAGQQMSCLPETRIFLTELTKSRSLTFIFRSLNPNVAADGGSYLRFKAHPCTWVGIIPIVHKEFHLMGHGLAFWPVELKPLSHAI